MFRRKHIGTGSGHQLAELVTLLILQAPGLVGQCLQFGVEIAGSAHRFVLLLYGEDEPVIAVFDQRQRPEISWDYAVPRKMNSFEGALIRRADVLLYV